MGVALWSRRAPSLESEEVAARDERLLSWREILTGGVTAALRTYSAAWAAEGDDAVRATAGVGILDLDDTRSASVAETLPRTGPLAEVVRALDLTLGEEALLAAAWWTAMDPQLARAFSCLHDDGRKRWASPAVVQLALARMGIEVPMRASGESALVRSGLLDSAPDPAHPLALTPAGFEVIAASEPSSPEPVVIADRLVPVVEEISRLVAAGGRVVVRCGAVDDRSTLRDAVAASLSIPLAPVLREPGPAALMFRLGRELPVAVTDDPPQGAVLVLGSSAAAVPVGWHTMTVAAPSVAEAQAAWRSELQAHGLVLEPSELALVASQLPLGEAGVREVVSRAAEAAVARGRVLLPCDIFTALRAQAPQDPQGLARCIPARTSPDDLVLSEATITGLNDVIAHARWSAVAQESLEFTSARGRATVALFHGPSGTGKTAAAEAVATAIERDLWIVDLSKVVSKWLGETQRHLDTILDAAATAGVVLLFDEADGLFGKRGEVSDARDRYANLEIDHLLQRIELHTGVVLLTSNRPAAIDEGFARRIRLSVRFDLPNYDQRLELWRRMLTPALLEPGTDPEVAAREELSGAAIRAAALAAVVYARAEGTDVTQAHLETAVRRELEKTGRHLTARTVAR